MDCMFFFFQAEDGIRDLVRSRGLGDVYKRQGQGLVVAQAVEIEARVGAELEGRPADPEVGLVHPCLLYTSDAADERSSVDLGGRRIIKKKNSNYHAHVTLTTSNERYREYMYIIS